MVPKAVFLTGLAVAATVPLGAAATFTYTAPGTTTTTNWSGGPSSNWNAVPVSDPSTILNFGGVLNAATTVTSNNDLSPGNGTAPTNFLLNRANFTFAGPASGTAPIVSITGNPLEFVTSSGATPVLNIANTGTVAPTFLISNALVLTNNLSVTNTSTAVLSGVISGASTLTKTLTGTLTLTGANTFSGATIIGTSGSLASAGTLSVGGAAGTIATSSSVTVIGSSRLLLDNSVANNNDRLGNNVNLTLGGELALTGNGATASTTEAFGTLGLGAGGSFVTVGGTGAGQLVTLAASGLSRANNGTGVIRGTLLGSATAASGHVTIGGTAGTGLTQVGTNTSATGLNTGTVKNLTIVPYLLGDNSLTGIGTNFVTYDTTSGLRLLGTSEQSLIASGAAGDNVKTAAGTNTVATGAKTFNSLLLGAGTAATPATTAATIVGGGGATDSLTLTSGALANIATTATGTGTISGFSSIIFGTTGANEAIITNTNTLGALTIGSPIDTGAAGGALTKTGGGNVILSAANLYTGATTVNQGTLTIGNGTSGNLAAGSGTVTTNPGATVGLNAGTGTVFANTFLNSGTITNGAGAATNVNTISSNVTGVGGITINAGNVLALTGSNTYGVAGSTATGLTSFNGAGTLRAVAGVGNSTTTLGVTTSTALSVNSYLTVNTGAGAPAVLDLRADAATTFATAGLTIGGSGNGLTINVDHTVGGAGSNQLITLGGNIDLGGNGNFGADTINVTGSNDGYTLAINRVGQGASAAATFNTSGANLTIASLEGNSGFNGQGPNTSGGAYTFTGSGTTTVQGQNIPSNGSRVQTLNFGTAGATDLTGSVTLAGTTTGGGGFAYNVNSGTLNVNSVNGLGDGLKGRTLTINGGALDNTSGSAITVAAGTNLLATSINGDFAFGGTNALNIGTGAINLGATASDTRTITTNGTTSALTLGGVISNGTNVVVQATALAKAGSGTLILSGSSVYTGGTTINAGTLLANGAIVGTTASATGLGAVTVNNGVLAGNGGILGAVTVGDGTNVAVISPGSSPTANGNGTGMLRTGSLNITTQSVYLVNLNSNVLGIGYDQLNVTGTITLAGNLNVNLAFTPASTDLFFILNNDGTDAVTGTFASIPTGFNISYTADSLTNMLTGGNDVALFVTPIPEPSSWAIIVLAFVGYFQRRRCVGYPARHLPV